jgi:hypothetical protein
MFFRSVIRCLPYHTVLHHSRENFQVLHSYALWRAAAYNSFTIKVSQCLPLKVGKHYQTIPHHIFIGTAGEPQISYCFYDVVRLSIRCAEDGGSSFLGNVGKSDYVATFPRIQNLIVVSVKFLEFRCKQVDNNYSMGGTLGSRWSISSGPRW